jgi:RNA polymerase sigma-70 factor (ECF subfamily)
MFERKSAPEGLPAACDVEIYRAVCRGSEEAIGTVYQRHGGLIYRYSLRMSRDPSIAEEVTQEVFLILLRQSERFDPSRAALSTWLCGIARRLIWRHLERRGRDVLMETPEDEGAAESWDDPVTALDRSEAVTAVHEGLDALPAELREVIVLCEFEEMKYEEAAMALGVPVGTVRSRLNRAKARLARLLRGPAVKAHGGRTR